MLTQYLTRTQRLLQNPGAPTPLYNTSDLTDYINEARGQVAGEGECIRAIGALDAIATNGAYQFSAITVDAPGVAGVINVRAMLLENALSNYTLLAPQPWEWFLLYDLNNSPVPAGTPTEWAQYGQGSAPQSSVPGASGGGSLYLFPIPNVNYTFMLDCVGYPGPLVVDTDPEAIPYLWTDAVPFFAAFLALLSSQGSARAADADRMFQRYQLFVQRARQAATPSIVPFQYAQAPNPTLINKVGGGQPAQRQAG